ncbi:MAG: cupin domain-containing protein [Solidesulfovibrio magneticus str. Maddingley MBC34]|uniref:Cupin domain-containing protein n=1 Tax=Solidesulfovibrio magneticus str. Maddingley MBC34 TaxID=1206767 RepID=K6GL19_9BACT|nr:MAG: cupin domain-containing protein [Solidesulfovibrio magneticus str. Maddingley MBC34]
MTATPPYVIAGKETILTTDQARVTLMTLAPGQAIPPHRHSQVTDMTFCLEGQAAVRFPDTGETVALSVGQHASVPPGRLHEVANVGDGVCRLLLSRDRGSTIFCLNRRAPSVAWSTFPVSCSLRRCPKC